MNKFSQIKSTFLAATIFYSPIVAATAVSASETTQSIKSIIGALHAAPSAEASFTTVSPNGNAATAAAPTETQQFTPTSPITTVVSAKSGAFTPSSHISQTIKQQLINELANKFPGKEAMLRERFSNVDIFAIYQPELDKMGYPMYNLTSAFAVLFSGAYGILQEIETTPSQDMALWQQLDGVISNNPKISAMSNENKQSIAEIIYWTMMIFAYDYTQAKEGAPGFTMTEVKKNTVDFLAQFGVDPHNMVIGDGGVHF